MGTDGVSLAAEQDTGLLIPEPFPATAAVASWGWPVPSKGEQLEGPHVS